ncbi:MAG: AsmA family protein, partial [Ramlibacter sp.]|nr:AsmA family protein [Ramlibacter sp.]
MYWLGGVLLVAALLGLLLAFFPWDWLRGPLNRYVSGKTGRHFEITRHLDVKLGATTRILADGIEFANPSWAHDPYLVRAEGAEIQVRLMPLLARRIELPLIALRKPELGLQVEADGRRSWALGQDTSDPRNLPDIGAVVVDSGALHFLAPAQGADIRADFALQDAAAAPQQQQAAQQQAALPLTFKARGSWHKLPFEAEGRTGNVLELRRALAHPFPAQLRARTGGTVLRASGEVASLATLDGANANVELEGRSLADLYQVLGVVMPETPRYSARFHLAKDGDVWHARGIQAKLGNSDLGGELNFDRSQAVPLLTGDIRSKAVDFEDLAPLVGLAERPRSAAALPQVKGGGEPSQRVHTAAASPLKVLPTAALDVQRLKAMNADVRWQADSITHTRELPLDRARMHVVLRDSVLRLDPMELGLAGGRASGHLRIDGRQSPALAQLNLDLRAVELNKLFPHFKLNQASFGKLHGDIDLSGRGNSVAQMLAGASGNVDLLMGRGQMSNLMLEIVGLDGGEILKFMLKGDRNVQVRCAAAGFNVQHGLMTPRVLLLDTSDTVIRGEGSISLAQETINLTMNPQPKDRSILALRTPLHITGPFTAPKAGPDKGALATRVVAALALGAFNPLLALAATVETGPGRDADCSAALREA